jgi:hypothetical protein
MKSLELIKRWTGDGFGDAGARLLTQVKRNDKVALYSKTVENGGIQEGYEVFLIKMRYKGDKLPGGLVEEEDREVYPSANSFGKTAWQISTLARAEEKFEALTKCEIEDESVKEPITLMVPVGEFTVGEMAEANKIEYPKAFLFIKSAVEAGSVKFVREERRNAKGKPSKIYSKS